MLFRRRIPEGFWQRLRVWLWPRRNWRRSTLYHGKRLRRLSGTPYALAMGAAIGAAVSTTPLLGLHVLISLAVCLLFRANLVAAAIGTSVGNPLTYPVFWAGSFEIGRFLLPGTAPLAAPAMERSFAYGSFEHMLPVIGPMLIGAVPIGLGVGCVTYLVVYRTVRTYRSSRRLRLAEKRRAAVPLSEASAPGPGLAT